MSHERDRAKVLHHSMVGCGAAGMSRLAPDEKAGRPDRDADREHFIDGSTRIEARTEAAIPPWN